MAGHVKDVQDIDHGWDEILEQLKEADGLAVKVGVVGDKANDIEKGSQATVGDIAIWQEFGTSDGRVPERSFIRAAIDANEPEIAEYQQRAAKAVFDLKRISVRQGLGVIGQAAVGFIKTWIREGAVMPADLAPSTLARRTKPPPGRESLGEPIALLDTGQLIGSISYELVDKGSHGGDDDE